MTKSLKQFINKANKKHNNKYDYSLIDEYVTYKTLVKIICPIHGVFLQKPDLHLRTTGCQQCGKNITRGKKSNGLQGFIEKANLLYNYKYDYSLIVEYKNNKTHVPIICPLHGIFLQRPDGHLFGKECYKCSRIQIANKLRSNTNIFVAKANQIHNGRYDYSLVNYKDSKIKIKIICKQHGIFKQIPSDHLQGVGCPKCIKNKGETAIRFFLEKNNIKYDIQKSFSTCKNKNKLRFDFYLLDYNLLIEYQGKGHYVPVNFGGINNERALRNFDIQQKNDSIKRQWCKQNNIDLLEIKYDDNINNILISYLF